MIPTAIAAAVATISAISQRLTQPPPSSPEGVGKPAAQGTAGTGGYPETRPTDASSCRSLRSCPAPNQVDMDRELVEHLDHGLVDHVVDALGTVIKGGNRWENHTAGIGDLLH